MNRTVIGFGVWATVSLLACQRTSTADGSEMAPTEDVEYRGETTNGPLPAPEDVPAEPEWEEDAGSFVIDRRCCQVVFRIDVQEPGDATGFVTTPIDGMRDGLQLTRTDSEWTASTCLSLNVTVPYRYEFSWSDPDGGERGDGGVSVRVSSFESSMPDGQGGQTNVYRVQDDCGAADASVGLRP